MTEQPSEPIMFYNGQFIPMQPVIWPDEKGINYGLGDFEGIRAYNGAIFRLDEHVERLFFSSNMLYLKIPFTKKEIKEAIKTVATKNDLKDCYFRPLVWDATRKIGIHGKPEKVGIAIMAKPFGKYIDKGSEGLELMISSYRRPHPDTTITEAKFTANYHNSFLATTEAHDAGYDEALLLDTRSMVSELPGANIMIIEKDKIITPPRCASILPGITRDTLIRMAHDDGWEVIEEDISKGRLFKANGAFACGTAMEVGPIKSVNGHLIGDGKIEKKTKLLQERYKRIVNGEVPEYKHMLTHLYS
jgi:branched-chain amino acid aminotransferase